MYSKSISCRGSLYFNSIIKILCICSVYRNDRMSSQISSFSCSKSSCSCSFSIGNDIRLEITRNSTPSEEKFLVVTTFSFSTNNTRYSSLKCVSIAGNRYPNSYSRLENSLGFSFYRSICSYNSYLQSTIEKLYNSRSF